MYLRKTEKTDEAFIKENFSEFNNMYFYEKTDISRKDLYALQVKHKLYKSKRLVEENKNSNFRSLEPISTYRRGYYYKLLKFCQSLPEEVYGNVFPYIEKYGIRKLKEMYKLSIKINSNENKN